MEKNKRAVYSIYLFKAVEMLPTFHIQISNIFLEVLVIVVETCNQCKVCATAVMVSVNEEFVLRD